MKSLQSLFVLTACLVLTASAQDPVDDARAAVEAAGGMVMETAIGSGEWVVGFHIHGKDVTDADLSHVARMTGVVEVNLGGTGIGDTGLEHLAGMTGLKKLYLQKTKVTSVGFAPLANLDSLVYLNLYDTGVDDAIVAVYVDDLLRCFRRTTATDYC